MHTSARCAYKYDCIHDVNFKLCVRDLSISRAILRCLFCNRAHGKLLGKQYSSGMKELLPNGPSDAHEHATVSFYSLVAHDGDISAYCSFLSCSLLRARRTNYIIRFRVGARSESLPVFGTRYCRKHSQLSKPLIKVIPSKLFHRFFLSHNSTKLRAIVHCGNFLK